MTLWKILNFKKTHLHRCKYVLSDVVKVWCIYGANWNMFRKVAQGLQILVSTLVHGAGACQYLPGTVWAYRRARYCLIQKVSDSWPYTDQSLPFKLRWWIFVSQLSKSHTQERVTRNQSVFVEFFWVVQILQKFSFEHPEHFIRHDKWPKQSTF